MKRKLRIVIAAVMAITLLFLAFGCAPAPAPDSDSFTVSVINATGGGVFDKDASVTVTAVVPSGKLFKNWTVGGTEVSTVNPYTFTVTEDITLTANFNDVAAQYTVTVESGTGGGKVTNNGLVTVTATIPDGKKFKNWMSGGEVISKANPYTFRVTADITLTASFENIPVPQYIITVEEGTGGGIFDKDSQVTVTATVPEGKIFSKWTTGTKTVSTENPYIFTASANIILTANFVDEEQTDFTHDLVVYGDTAAAVAAAVAASRQEIDVALVAPAVRLGGMLSGGLSATDLGVSADIIGGISREFFARNAVKKGKSGVDWYAEPDVAEEILKEMIAETQETDYGIDVFYNERLVEGGGVVMSGATIEKILCESGRTFSAKQFIDASYEGDLMMQSGVTYTFGREGRAEYGESLAGVVAPTVAGANNHQFQFSVPAYDNNGDLKYQEVSEEPIAEAGSSDKKIQAYNFRMCLTLNNKAAIPMPEDYDPARYNLLLDYIKMWESSKGYAPYDGDLFIIIQIGSTGKYDFNNNGAFSSDYIGGNYNYPDATYEERDRIWEEHYKYTAGLFYFLSNDPNVPQNTRNYISRWGLPLDEYEDTGNWSPQLYVREGRRMVGEYVMTQHDIEQHGSKLTKTDSIGMGSYRSDSHHVQRYVTNQGYIRNEGNMEVEVGEYEIPYRMILPKENEADNLLVSCTFSASHVSYSSIRMEPQYMIIGQAAGTAASIAIKDNLGVHDIGVKKLQSTLKEDSAVLSKGGSSGSEEGYDYAGDVLLYDTFDSYTDGWGITQGAAGATSVTQNDSYVTIKKTNTNTHGYITRNSFSLSAGDFNYGFRAKLNSNSVAEFTVRSGLYQIKTVLTRPSDPAQGTVQDNYKSPTKTKTLDTSVWHDYQVVVNGTDYSYGVYVDGVLAWSGAASKGGGSNMIKLGADTAGSSDGGGATDFDLDYFKIENGAKTDGINLVGYLFKDADGFKLHGIEEASGDITCSVAVENASNAAKQVKLVMEVYDLDTVKSTVTQTLSVESFTVKDLDITTSLSQITARTWIKVTVLVGDDFETSLIPDGIILAANG